MLKINEEQIEIMAKYGIFLLKPEINTDKTTLISISKRGKEIKYKEDKDFINIIIADKKTDLPLLEFSLNRNLFSIKKYMGDTENILEIIEIDNESSKKEGILLDNLL